MLKKSHVLSFETRVKFFLNSD